MKRLIIGASVLAIVSGALAFKPLSPAANVFCNNAAKTACNVKVAFQNTTVKPGATTNPCSETTTQKHFAFATSTSPCPVATATVWPSSN